jgi:hypothetical protein
MGDLAKNVNISAKILIFSISLLTDLSKSAEHYNT